MRILSTCIIFVTLVFLSSCFKEDEIVKPHEQGDTKTITLDSSIYLNQCFIDLDSVQLPVISANESWDISFETSDLGWRVYVNSANLLGVYPTGVTDFINVTPESASDKYIFDASSGNPDSSAFNNWLDRSIIPFQPTGEIFLIGKWNGIKYNPEWMIKILTYTDSSYTFEFAAMGESPVEKTIFKDPRYNKIYYTFKGGGVMVNVEPEKNSWDMLFTQYGTILFTDEGIPTPYFVRGVLINPEGVEVNVDSIHIFSDIDYQYAGGLQYSSKADIIGYDWKDVKIDFNSGTAVYLTRSNVNYIIRSTKGFFYKIRFIDYYNYLGKVGYPTFELQKL